MLRDCLQQSHSQTNKTKAFKLGISHAQLEFLYLFHVYVFGCGSELQLFGFDIVLGGLFYDELMHFCPRKITVANGRTKESKVGMLRRMYYCV